MDAEAEAAFRDFVAGRGTALVRSAFLLTGDRGHAEDAVQAALAKVYVAWPRIRRHDAVEAYTRRVLIREVLSWRRRRRVTLVFAADPPDVTVRDTSAHVDEDIRQALLTLPNQQRAVVVLRYFDDMSETQVADALGISVGAVKQHTSRALSRLRALLADNQNIEETPR